MSARRHIVRAAIASAAVLLLAAVVAGCTADLRAPVTVFSYQIPGTGIATDTPRPASRTTAAPKATPVPLEPVVPGTHSGSALRARLSDASSARFRVVSRTITTQTATVTQSFRFQGRKQTITFKVPRADLRWSDGRELRIRVSDTESHEDRISQFWRSVVSEPHQTSTYEALSKSFRSIRAAQQLDDNEYAELMTAWVQQMPYDDAEAKSGASNRYPVVTAVKGTGVCGDKSVLLAGLLAHEGYKVALFEFEGESHMSVGLGTTTKGYRETGYAFLETTGPGLIGEVGAAYGPDGSITLRSRPILVTISTTGTRYSAGKDVTWIVGRRRAYEKVYASLAGTIEEARSNLDRYDGSAVARFNEKVGRVNRAASTINTVQDHPDDREALKAYLEMRGEP